MKIKPALRSFILRSASLALLAAPSLHAADRWWDGGTANWSGGSSGLTGWSTVSNATTPNPGTAPGASDNLFFNITTNNTASNVVSHANANRAALSMTFNTSGTTNFRAGGSTAASILTLGSGGITVNAGAGAVTIGQTPASYGNITVALGADQTWTNDSTADLTVVGRITGAGRDLIKSGTGRLVLQGDNTFSGTTTVDGGAIQIQRATALGSTAAGTIVNGTGTAGTANARLELAGGITVTGESLTISGVGNFNGALTSTSGANVWAGNVTIGASGTRIGASADASLEVSGIIDSGADPHGLIIRTADLTGTVILSGANTYLGNTQVLIGKLQLAGGDNRLPVGTNLTLNSASSNPGAEFDLNGTNQEIAGLALGGAGDALNNSVNNSSLTASTLTVNTGASASSYGGILKGNLSLTKEGTNSLTLTGTSNTYTGGTTINAGTLALMESGAAGSGVITLGGANEADLAITSGITIANNITFSNSNASSSVTRSVAASDNYTTGTSGDLKSQFTNGTPDTVANILDGTASVATDMVMAFSASSAATNDSARRSDVFSITGTGTDTYVVQLVVGDGLASDSFLAYLSGGSWVAAGTNFFEAAWSNTNVVGDYGFHADTNSAWAVVDFNGSFAVIPEPTTALAGLLLSAGLLRRRRK